MKCNNCGAPIEQNSNNCSYCGVPVSDHGNLKLEQFILYIEEEFQGKKEKYDGKVVLSFILLACLWLFISWYAYNHGNWVLFLTTFMGSGGILFLVFGFFIIYFYNKAVKEALDDKYREIINSYLFSKGISKPEFILKAKDILQEDALLLKNISYL